jgi:hypothetical protein
LNYSKYNNNNIKYDELNNVLTIIDSISEVIQGNLNTRRLLDTNYVSLSSGISDIESILSIYIDLIKGQMYLGQNQVEFLQKSFKIKVDKMFSNRDTFMITSPLSSEEIDRGINSSIVTLFNTLSSSTTSSSYIDSMSIIVMKSILFGEERRNFLTDPIHFQFTSTDTIDKELRIVLSHKYHKEYLYLQSNEQFNTTCYIGNYTLESYTCTDTGYVIDHKCKGYYEELSSMCPPNVERAVCMLIETSSIHSCATLSFDSISTTCECSYKYNTNGLIGRKLQVNDLNNNDISGLDNDISGLDIVSISTLFVGEFVGTKTTAITYIISENEVNNSKIIPLSLSFLWIGMIFIVILFNHYQERIKKKKLNHKIINNTSNIINPVVMKNYLRVYILIL